jgi:hypothetical protein
MGNHWYSVDVSSDYVENRVDELFLRFPAGSYIECATTHEYVVTPLAYTKSVNGLDVLTGRYSIEFIYDDGSTFSSDNTLEVYINPETYEVKYLYLYDNTDYGCLKDVIEFIYEDNLYIRVNYPAETENTITYADIAKYQEAIMNESWGAAGGH